MKREKLLFRAHHHHAGAVRSSECLGDRLERLEEKLKCTLVLAGTSHVNVVSECLHGRWLGTFENGKSFSIHCSVCFRSRQSQWMRYRRAGECLRHGLNGKFAFSPVTDSLLLGGERCYQPTRKATRSWSWMRKESKFRGRKCNFKSWSRVTKTENDEEFFYHFFSSLRLCVVEEIECRSTRNRGSFTIHSIFRGERMIEKGRKNSRATTSPWVCWKNFQL